MDYSYIAATFTYFTGATSFMKKLDDRHKRDSVKKGNSNMQAKQRVLGSPSCLPRVPAAPEWAVIDEPASATNQQQGSTADNDSDSHHSSSGDSDSDFNIADLI